jgi:Fe2+ transport system protein FeoA
LRELGFREEAELRLVCVGGAIIAQVQGAKICLSHHMAQSIMVAAV